MSYQKKRPLGKFSIDRDILLRDWRSAKDIFSRVVVVKVECDFLGDVLIYTAFCDEFEDVEEGAEPPTYSVDMFREDDGSIRMTRFTKWT